MNEWKRRRKRRRRRGRGEKEENGERGGKSSRREITEPKNGEYVSVVRSKNLVVERSDRHVSTDSVITIHRTNWMDTVAATGITMERNPNV